MAVTYGFFDSVDGDRTYSADDMSTYFDGLISDGVYEAVGSALVVKPSSAMTISIGTGRAIVNCKWISNSTIKTITLTSADTLASRTDLVVVKYNADVSVRAISIEVLTGYSTLPADTETIKYLELAQIDIPAGTTTITQDMITDMRGTSKCPWVTGLIEQVDTSTLFLQFKTAWNTFIQSLTDDLRVDTHVTSYRSTTYTTGSESLVYYTNILASQLTDSDASYTVLCYVDGKYVPYGSKLSLQGSDYSFTWYYNNKDAGSYVYVTFFDANGKVKTIPSSSRIDVVILASEIGEIV